MPIRCRWPPENSCGKRLRCWRVEADQLAAVRSRVRGRRCGPGDLVHPQRLADDLADRQPRVERGERVLEHDLDLLADRPQLLAALADELRALERFSRRSPAAAAARTRAVVDLPQPDSPTRPSVSRSARSKLTPQTAWATATVRRTNPPPRTGKCFTMSCTETSVARRWRRDRPVADLADGEAPARCPRPRCRSRSARTGGAPPPGSSRETGGRRPRARARRRVSSGSSSRQLLEHRGAPRRERARGRQVDQRRRAAGDRPQRTAVGPVHPRQRAEQAERVRHLALVEQDVGRARPRPPSPRT